MKRNLIYAGALLIGMAMTTSCTDDDALIQEQNNGLTIVKATIENAAARTTVSTDATESKYQALWSVNDKFTVGTKGNMAYQGEGGEATGTFTGTLTEDLANGDIAFYPAYEGENATYIFKSEYTSLETAAPMVATYNGTSFSFSHLAAMVRVSASSLVSGTEYVLTISSAQTMTGEATLNSDNTSLSVPTNGTSSITVTFTAESNALVFDAPIPAQDYTNLALTLKTGETTVLTKKIASLEAEAGNLYYLTKDLADGWMKVSSTEYEIWNEAGLKWLADQVNNEGNTFKGATVTLTDDIELNNEAWTPIGAFVNGAFDFDHSFQGSFDGGNHTISNLNVEVTNGAAGLFGGVQNCGTIKDVKLL